ncbi:hypothetical protein OKW49_008449 [Paraburkholderia youngii]|uniref:hypothetical protein n=1 Tax=Paraburkholderia youngii TaxID=2782701 RepID=UPI003D257240
MPNNKNYRSPLQPSAARHSKALLLPMPRKEASDLVLRARIALERLRNGEVDRPLINLVLQVTIIASFITRAGHGKLDINVLDTVKRGLEDIVVTADNTGTWDVPEGLTDDLTAVINEYDRQICVTRMEIVVRASDHLDRLIHRTAHEIRAADSSPLLAP